MNSSNDCPACQQSVLPTPPDNLNSGTGDGVHIAMSRDAAGEDFAQRWHRSCWDAHARRAQRRSVAAADPVMLEEVRKALR